MTSTRGLTSLVVVAILSTLVGTPMGGPDIHLFPFQQESRDNVFCPPSLMSPSSSRAATAICNMRGPEYYNGSAADLFMAARFGGNMTYGVGFNLTGQQASAPYTTEKNIPNMVADYVIELLQEQNKWDSAKSIRATAQVDLLLCSDDNCNIVADIWKHDEQTMAMGFTTLLGSTSAIPQGFITPETHTIGRVAPLQNWTQLGGRSGKGGAQPTITNVQWAAEVVNDTIWLNKQKWATSSPPQDLLDRMLEDPLVNWSIAHEKLAKQWAHAFSETVYAPDMMQLGGMSLLLAENNNSSANLGYGAFRANLLARARSYEYGGLYVGLSDDLEYSLPITEQCVVVIFPVNDWMLQHGWGQVDDHCMHVLDFEHLDSQTPVYVFDSYFYQSQYFWVPTFRGNTMNSKMLKSEFNGSHVDYTSYYCDTQQQQFYEVGFNITSDKSWKLAMVDRYNERLVSITAAGDSAFDAEHVLQSVTFDRVYLGKAPKTYVPWRELQMDPYQGLGYYGITMMCGAEVYSNSKLKHPCSIVSQAKAGCFTECNESGTGHFLRKNNKTAWDLVTWYDCGGCSALQVGGAPIAAWELTTAGSTLNPFVEAVRNTDRLLQLIQVATWQAKDTPPWCVDGYDLPLDQYPRKIWGTFSDQCDNFAALSDKCLSIDPRPVCVGYMNGTGYSFRTPNVFLFEGYNGSYATDCKWWDDINIGYVDNGNQKGKYNTSNTTLSSNGTSRPISDLLRVRMYNLSSERGCRPEVSLGGQCFTPFLGYGELHPPALDRAVHTLLGDAVVFLNDKALSELATTDTTKTWNGALVDTATILVAVVALASGLHDLVELLEKQCHKFLDMRPLPGCITSLPWCPTRISEWCDNDEHTLDKLAATALACALVLLALITAPIVTVVAERMARQNNADGTTSDTAWLAADIDSGEGPYVLLAAVSVNLKAEYDGKAEVLTWINLAMAAIATVCLWYKVLWPAHKYPQGRPLGWLADCLWRAAQFLWQTVLGAMRSLNSTVLSCWRRLTAKFGGKPTGTANAGGIPLANLP